jgi:hypothetical protein
VTQSSGAFKKGSRRDRNDDYQQFKVHTAVVTSTLFAPPVLDDAGKLLAPPASRRAGANDGASSGGASSGGGERAGAAVRPECVSHFMPARHTLRDFVKEEHSRR